MNSILGFIIAALMLTTLIPITGWNQWFVYILVWVIAYIIFRIWRVDAERERAQEAWKASAKPAVNAPANDNEKFLP
jgi:uncharacterized membrane protein SirB2